MEEKSVLQFADVVNDNGSKVSMCSEFLTPEETKLLFDEILNNQRKHFSPDVFNYSGKLVPSPRLMCAFGEKPMMYFYSGISRKCLVWFPLLKELRDKVQPYCSHNINYALVNIYRDGKDSIGWHSDNEKDIVEHSTIASISLGIERTFILRKRIPSLKCKEIQLKLGDRSLLLMSGKTQEEYLHSIPKEPGIEGIRINVTFRALKEK